MQRIILIYLFLVLLSTTSKSQLSISGLVLDGHSGKPLEKASVFVNNTTVGTVSSPQGTFKLDRIKPGQYELIVSMVGYEAALQTLQIEHSLDNLTIKLKPKEITLRPVVVLPDKLRQYYLTLFKRGFIGTDENASACKLLNPEVLFFDFDKDQRTLKVSADEFIVMENKKLGYRVEFLLKQFSYTMNMDLSYMTYYDGQVLFKELDGGKLKRKQWTKNRQQTYRGSSMHFFRAAAANQLDESGFVMHTLIRKKNDQRPPDQIIEAKIQRFKKPEAIRTSTENDSLDFWIKKSQMPKQVQYLLRDTLREDSIFYRTDRKGVFAMRFENFLYVVYAKNNKSEFRSAYYDHSVNALPYSVINFKEEFTYFDQSGIVLNPSSLIFEGYFGEKGGMASMLPYDFDPLKN